MKKFLIVCNPYSGRGTSPMFADKLKKRFIKEGQDAQVYTSQSIEKMAEYFKELKEKNAKFDAVIFLGGDGTFGIAIDTMIKAGLDLPVTIFPLGTVNDFAKQIGMKKNVKKCVKAVLEGQINPCDVANVNGDYVINVACGGYFTHGANNYTRKAKKFWGKMAYYGKGFFNVFDMKPEKIKFTVDGEEIVSDKIIMYLILNSKSAGGFRKIGQDARIDDGYFDLCAIKKANIFSLAITFLKILCGKHQKNKNIIYRKGQHFKVELVSNKKVNPKFLKSDMDGNLGRELPLDVQVTQGKITVIVSKKLKR